MTTYGIDDWDAMSEFYGTPLDEVAIYEQRIYTLMHELSHLLGAPDHYCYEDNATENDPCSNPNCDECAYDLDYERKCTMGDPSDFWFVADEYLYCSDCINIITAHFEDHHYPLDN